MKGYIESIYKILLHFPVNPWSIFSPNRVAKMYVLKMCSVDEGVEGSYFMICW